MSAGNPNMWVRVSLKSSHSEGVPFKVPGGKITLIQIAQLNHWKKLTVLLPVYRNMTIRLRVAILISGKKISGRLASRPAFKHFPRQQLSSRNIDSKWGEVIKTSWRTKRNGGISGFKINSVPYQFFVRSNWTTVKKGKRNLL